MKEKEDFKNYGQARDLLQEYVKLQRELKKGVRFLAFLSVDVVGSTAMKEGQGEFLARDMFLTFRSKNKLKWDMCKITQQSLGIDDV